MPTPVGARRKEDIGNPNIENTKEDGLSREHNNSVAGTRTRVARVRAEYPNHLDYNGDAKLCIKINYLFGPWF
jgi:hypothetical protein